MLNQYYEFLDKSEKSNSDWALLDEEIDILDIFE